MSLLAWISLFAISSLFWCWLLFLGGADWLEGSWLAALFVHVRAVEWSAQGIKLFAGLSWLCQGIWFVIGVFVREVRPFG